MRFARLGPAGSEQPVVFSGGGYWDLLPMTSDIDRAFWENEGPSRVRDALTAGELRRLPDPHSMRVGPPIGRPGAIVCIGMNYAAHAAETGAEPPSCPVMFLKVPNTVIGPNDAITIPRGSTATDWEVELGVVIGKRTSYLDSPEQSAEHIAGYLVANDLSERDFQLKVSGGQWSKGKNAPGFSPLGPWLVTADEVSPRELRLTTEVNGELRQDSSTADQIFDVAFIVHHLSQYMVLDPGDLVLTGTPQGVALSGRFPYLSPGDVVEVEIEGLGRQRSECQAYEEQG